MSAVRRSAAGRASARRATAAVTLLTLVSLSSARAQNARGNAGDVGTAVDRIFSPWNSTHGPGCAVGIARGGKTLLARGYGMADLTSERPITANTILESGSVAKQFTAMAVLLLMQDGKLALDDDARKFLPELPQYGRVITVRHLLTHTSGLREWSNLVAWQGWPRGQRMHTQDVVFDLITRQQSLNYPVGDYYSYTNSGFLLLRTLVERVSGQSFAAFTTARIFAPLGMTQTRWRDDYTTVVPGLAQAYRRAADGWHLDMPFDNIIGAGGLYSTVSDWLRWNEALTNKTLGTAVTDSMTRQMTLTSGLKIQYAMGLTVSRYRGEREIAHSGSTAGYSTFLARYPDQDNLSIAVMCNSAGAPATAYTHAIVEALVPSLLVEAGPITISVPDAELQKLTGLYRDTRTNTVSTFSVAQGALRRGSVPLLPLQGGYFQAGATRMRFTPDASGRMSMRQPTADADTVIWVREATTRWTPSAAELPGYVGQYANAEIGATYTVALKNGRLHVFVRAGMEGPLDPTYKDAFENGGDAVWFTRDKKGRVTAMHIGNARAWDMVFTRLK
ncbi:MAG: serine hydrolase [Gemmatimonadaceae bacterium]|nr:serine hydrolase [Gemmatimonadaceae bacterium]